MAKKKPNNRVIVAYIGVGSGTVVYDHKSKSKTPATAQVRRYNNKRLKSGIKEPKLKRKVVPANKEKGIEESIQEIKVLSPINFGHLEYPSNLNIYNISEEIYNSNKEKFYVFKAKKIEDVSPEQVIEFYLDQFGREFKFDEETGMYEDITSLVVSEEDPKEGDNAEGSSDDGGGSDSTGGEPSLEEGDIDGDGSEGDSEGSADDDDPLED